LADRDDREAEAPQERSEVALECTRKRSRTKRNIDRTDHEQAEAGSVDPPHRVGEERERANKNKQQTNHDHTGALGSKLPQNRELSCDPRKEDSRPGDEERNAEARVVEREQV